MLHRIFGVVSLTTIVLTGCGLDIQTPPQPIDSSSPPVASDTSTAPSGSGQGSAAPITDVPASDNPAPTSSPADVPSAPVPPPDEPATALSPFRATNELTYQKPIIWTIGAFDSSTLIHFTTDGSAPTTSSPNATGKVSLTDLSDGTRIQWIAGNSMVVHDFTVHVDATLSTATHSIVDNVRFSTSDGPIARVKPGALIDGKAGAAIWNGQTSCPTCIDQITLGITTAQTCLVNIQPNTYPGAAGTDVGFSIQAPTTPGVYKLKTGFEQQYKCSDAIGHALQDTEVGTIIVD